MNDLRWLPRAVLTAFVLLFLQPIDARADTISVRQWDGAVCVYVRDLDLLRAAYRALDAEVTLDGGAPYAIDLASNSVAPAIIVRTRQTVRSVRVLIRTGDQTLIDETFDAGPMIEAAVGVSYKNETAYVEVGSKGGDAPRIAMPDLSAAPLLKSGRAARSVDIAAAAASVVSDLNFPLVASHGGSVISRQTAAPFDASSRSVYVTLKSPMFDDAGKPAGNVHYLAEIPVDPAWAEGSDDVVVALDPSAIRIHLPTERFNGTLVTGSSDGGLGQMVGTSAVDDDGHIYFSTTVPSTVVRFNVHEARYEVPPIDVYEAMKTLLPGNANGKDVRLDCSLMVTVGGGRMFLTGFRYANYSSSYYVGGIVSFPLDNWHNAAAFRSQMHLLVGTWPGSPNALHDQWPAENEAAFKLSTGFYHDGFYYFSPYADSRGGPWKIGIAGDGSASSFAETSVTLTNEASHAAHPPYPTRATDAFDVNDYGLIRAEREKVRHALFGVPDDSPQAQLAAAFSSELKTAKAEGSVTVCYDALGAMRLDRKHFAAILDNQSGPSLAPCYMAAEIPFKPGHLIGVGEYGYYLAEFDLTRAHSGKVIKRYLKLDLGELNNELPVRAGLGPYGYVWRRDGEVDHFTMTGYSGIADVRYAVDGRPLDRFVAHHVHQTYDALDHAESGRILHARFPLLGVDGRIFFTGDCPPDRAGTPFSNGLLAVTPPNFERATRLSYLSRTRGTSSLRSRIVIDADGSQRQQLLLPAGEPGETYLEMLKPWDAIENVQPRLGYYECTSGEDPTDVLSFALPEQLHDLAFSADRRYLVMLFPGAILTFDLDTWRYADAKRIAAGPWYVKRPNRALMRGPNDRLYFTLGDQGGSATMYALTISPRGEIIADPHINLTGIEPLDRGVAAFVADASGDGSCDLAVGPNFRSPGSTMWIIPDVVPARR